MIDTIKLSVNKKGNEFFFENLLYRSNQRTTGFFVNSRSGIVERQEAFVMNVHEYDNFQTLIINGKIQTPSHLYDIYYRCFEDRVDLEFSIPKFIYGNNVFQLQNHSSHYLYQHNPYYFFRQSLKVFFNTMFPSVKINYGNVVLKRVDFCFNQFFKSYDESIEALKYIKLKHQSKSDKLNYEYGFVELTKSKYLKIYHKGEEFKKHDYNKMKLQKDADLFQKISDRILRYERKCTPKNWSYNFNVNVKMKNFTKRKKQYYLAKKHNRVKKDMRRDFESIQNFTVGLPIESNYLKMPEEFFNSLYFDFMEDIRKKFTIGKMSVDRLQKESFTHNKNKSTNVKILSYIKVFKSLKRAQESGAFSKRTLQRYEKYMSENNLSTTRLKSNINQDWTYKQYRYVLLQNNVYPSKYSKLPNF